MTRTTVRVACRRLCVEELGANFAEYALLVFLIAIACAGATKLLGQVVIPLFNVNFF